MRLPVGEFDLDSVTFTYGDLLPTFSEAVTNEREYRKRIYRWEGILELIGRYGLPQDWNADGRHGPERYVEAQVWHPIAAATSRRRGPKAILRRRRQDMKVIAINGSPRAQGNCAFILGRLGERLGAKGIDFEAIQVGNKVFRGCMACGECAKRQDGKCAFGSDGLDEAVAAMREADGIVLASPVHYSGVAGTMKAFLDRAFYVAGANGGLFRHKVGAALVTVRRSGGSSALDCLNHYLAYSEMLVATSNYWNIVHGRLPEEVLQDAEGMQTVDLLADDLAWMLTMRESTKEALPGPERIKKVMTNFIR